MGPYPKAPSPKNDARPEQHTYRKKKYWRHRLLLEKGSINEGRAKIARAFIDLRLSRLSSMYLILYTAQI